MSDDRGMEPRYARVRDGTVKQPPFPGGHASWTLHPFAESGIDSCGTFHVPNNRRSAGGVWADSARRYRGGTFERWFE